MSDRDRHSKRRFRDEPDPDDRYDPKQGAKRSKREDEGSEPGMKLCNVSQAKLL